jgi:long-subunit fatty acid transport protein
VVSGLHHAGVTTRHNDKMGVAYMTGATYDFSPTTRVGLSYQSEIKINFDGHLEISPIGTDINSDTELTMAGYVSAGLHHDLNDKLGLDLTVGWDNWSVLNNIFVSPSALGSTDLGDAKINADYSGKYSSNEVASFAAFLNWRL